MVVGVGFVVGLSVVCSVKFVFLLEKCFGCGGGLMLEKVWFVGVFWI